METIKTALFTVLLFVITCFWVLFSAEGFSNYFSEYNLLFVVTYILTFLLFWSVWILIGSRYINIGKGE
jgi:hypothetical protein